VTCEEIVDHDIIKSSPHLTIVPAFRVCAVIEEPYGSHPTELPGYRNRDMAMNSLILDSFAGKEGVKSLLDEWVYSLPDRTAYLEHYVKVFGQASLDRIRAKSYYSAPANYGIAFESAWDPNGQAWELGVDMEGLERLIEEKGEIVDVE
jgi:glutaconate CoA-transferase subunit A